MYINYIMLYNLILNKEFDMSAQHEKLVAAVNEMQADFDKFFDKGNGAAGTRVRKSCQELIKLCKEVRNEVTAAKNAKKQAKGE